MVSTDAGRAASRALHRAGWLLHAHMVEVKLYALRDAVKYNFDPNQPRVPAGNPDGGQWTDGDGSVPSPVAAQLSGEGQKTPAQSLLQLAGGFTDDQLGLTVQTFASTYCRGMIHSMLPGQFYQMTIAEVMAAAKQGDASARRCLKLLGRDVYRK